jgi:hypothetical protein
MTGENFRKSAFSRTIFAHDGVNLSSVNGVIYSSENFDI